MHVIAQLVEGLMCKSKIPQQNLFEGGYLQ